MEKINFQCKNFAFKTYRNRNVIYKNGQKPSEQRYFDLMLVHVSTQLGQFFSNQVTQNVLINMSSHQVSSKIIVGHDRLDNGHQAPECILFGHEQQGDGSQSIQPLTIANRPIVFTVGNEYTPQSPYSIGFNVFEMAIVGQSSQEIQFNLFGRRVEQ